MPEIILLAFGISGYFILYLTWWTRRKIKRDPYLSENWKVYLSDKRKYILYVVIFTISTLAIGGAAVNFNHILAYFNAK